MQEVEVKAKIKDLQSIKIKLTEMGCSFSEPLVQKDIIFLHNSTKTQEILKDKVTLRIRNTNDKKYTFTLKKKLTNELDNIEREIIINDPKQAEDILNYMNYYEVIRVSKTRIESKYQDMTICLDEVEKLGSFIEVEKLTTNEDGQEVQKNLSKFLASLGVSDSDFILKGYDTLMIELAE